jgi:hypothetical protein
VAAKYNYAGEVHKAAAHFGRAMHYGMIGDQEQRPDASTSKPAKRPRTVAPMILKPNFDEMVREYPGGFTVSIEGGQKYRWPINEPEYMKLLRTGKAYLSSYTHAYTETALDGVSQRPAYTWFYVQPNERAVYVPS